MVSRKPEERAGWKGGGDKTTLNFCLSVWWLCCRVCVEDIGLAEWSVQLISILTAGSLFYRLTFTYDSCCGSLEVVGFALCFNRTLLSVLELG